MSETSEEHPGGRAVRVPASTVSATVNPSLHTLRCVSVTMSSMPWRVNSSLRGRRRTDTRRRDGIEIERWAD